tara:strand:+ start:64 stop:711 length:648 start_codon:yes stop_codon:yes gene_type:complete
MKKIITAIVILLGTISTASADLGINVGIAGNTSIWHATGVEQNTNDTTQTEDAVGVAGYDSYFIEKTLGSRITIGYEHTPDALTTDTAENNRDTLTTGNSHETLINKVQLKFENLDMLYVHLNISESVYVKLGQTSVDVITNESLATGSTYSDFSLDGSLVGAGYNKSFSNGIFLRGEFNLLEFDDSGKKTSIDNTVQLNGLEGAQAKFALGYSF